MLSTHHDVRAISHSNIRPRIDPIGVMLFPARAFLAFGWLRAGIEKVIEPQWWAGQDLRVFLAEQRTEALPFIVPIGDWIHEEAAPAVSLLVVIAELCLGICMLSAIRLRQALWTAMILNTVFVLFGAVTPSAFYLMLQITLLLGLGVGTGSSARARVMWIVVCAATMVALMPFIATVHPAEVIHDPAIMLITVAGLFGAAQLFGLVNALGASEN